MSGPERAPVCLIDASIYIFRYYFSLPAAWISPLNGYSTEAVYGFTGFLLELMEKHAPGRLAACFDESLGSGFRHQLSPDYKASRVLPDEALAFQLQACRRVAGLLGIATFASDRYEADDLLASLYRVCARARSPIAVLTRDKDLAQLLRRPQDFLWDYGAGVRHYGADIEKRLGIAPAQMVDYLALVGDPIDDIPGVPGVGAKTAAALLRHGKSLKALYARPGQIADIPVRGAAGLAAKLLAHRDQVALSQQLAALVGDLPLIDSAAKLDKTSIKMEEFGEFCREMGWPDKPRRRALALAQARTGRTLQP